jgi:hypothetical protein
MADREQHGIKAAQPERSEWFYRVGGEREKGKKTPAVIKNSLCTVGVRNVLDPVKFTESHKVVIMAMGPKYHIDSGATSPEKLLPQIRGRID